MNAWSNRNLSEMGITSPKMNRHRPGGEHEGPPSRQSSLICGAEKFEIRNTKAETNTNFKNPNDPNQILSNFDIWISDLFRIPIFEIRIDTYWNLIQLPFASFLWPCSSQVLASFSPPILSMTSKQSYFCFGIFGLRI